MSMPNARESLEELSKGVTLGREGCSTRRQIAAAIRCIIEEELHRKKPMKMARATARPITAETRLGVCLLYEDKPHLTNREIGDVYGIDGARVSEILRAERSKLLNV